MKSTPIGYLTPVQEHILQGIFDNWGANPHWLLAGVPSWLPRGRPHNLRQHHAAYGYSLEPDVYWKTPAGEFLFELKCAEKGEPIGLAEVLHHRNILRKASPSSHFIETALFTSYNKWLRASLDELHQNGLKNGTVRLVESYYLDTPFPRKSLLWMDDPMAPWSPVPVQGFPKVFPPLTNWPGYKHWYKVNNADIWYGLQEPLLARPVFIEQPLVTIAAVEERANEYVSCSMTPPPFGTKAKHRWNEVNLYWA